MDEKKGFFDLLDAKSALILGFVTAVLTMCTLGFILGAIIYFKGGLTSRVALDKQQPGPNGQVADQGQQQPPAPTHFDVSPGHFPAQGDDKAKVKVVLFADPRCPFCERFFQDAEKKMVADYVKTGKVKFTYRNFAFLGPASDDASEAMECANEQGQFWKMHDWMFEHQADESDTAYYSQENLLKYATDLGMNKLQFADCMKTHRFAGKVQEDLADGQAAGVSGTPTIFINGDLIVGAVPYAQIKAKIDAELAK